MTMTTVRRWVCERCGCEQETPVQEQAPRWIAVITVRPPLAVPEDRVDRKHRCHDCADAFEEFMGAVR